MFREAQVAHTRVLGHNSNIELSQEIVKWLDQVLHEIKLIMVHLPGHDYAGGSVALEQHLLAVREGDQLVSLAMDEESGAGDLVHPVDVAEAVLNDVLENGAGLLPDDVSDRLKGRHQQESAWVTLSGYESSWA